MFYKTIFNINMQHAYFLDQGNKKFTPNPGDEIMTPDEKNEALKNYHIDTYLKLKPTNYTKVLIKNHRMMLVKHNQGFKFVTSASEEIISGNKKYKPIIALEDETALTFAIYTTDINFINYTEITDTLDSTLYLLSNEVNSLDTPITNIFDGDGTIDSSYLLSKIDSRTIIKTIIEEDETIINNVITQFSIANSIAQINNDEALNASEKKAAIDNILDQYIMLQKRKGLIGFIRLKVKGDSNKDLFQFISGEQYVTDTALEFTSQFINRNTFWRYFSSSDGVILTTTAKNPLTKNGFVEIDKTNFSPEPVEEYRYPNPTPTILIKESSNYFSEIYI